MGSWLMQRFQEQSGERRPANFHGFVLGLRREAGVVHAATTAVPTLALSSVLARRAPASGEGPARALHGSHGRLAFATRRQSSRVALV